MNTNPVIGLWKESLSRLLAYYDLKKGRLIDFFPKLFLFFICLNIFCYWWAIFTAYPGEMAKAGDRTHYFMVQFFVGFLGALFDSLSFFVTVYIARKALGTTSTRKYIAHLSVDLLIAFLASCWVVFVFQFSGWLVSLILQNPEDFSQRAYVYQNRVTEALQNPTDKSSLRNIYFGLVMGVSAMLPTMTHVSLSIHSIFRYFVRKYKRQ